MAAPLPALQRERIRLFLRILAGSAAVGIVYGAFISRPTLSTPVSMFVGLVNGVGIAGCIAGIEIFFIREGSAMKRLLQLPFLVVVVLKTAVYAGIITGFIVGAPQLAIVFPGVTRAVPLDRHTELITIGLSLALTLIIVIVMQASGLVGRRTFRNLVLGRYRRPRAERRFFLFVDVIGSTPIAERLGPLQAHRFLAAVFSATAEPVAAQRGEIYQYVGDEIVITWTAAEGVAGARPLRCFFMMEQSLQDLRQYFQQEFSAEPHLRAALHLGEVIAGEVGVVRRAIVYHGDVMNTASRLEQATRDQGVRFIASDAAMQALGPQADMEARDLGALALRGRTEPIRAWGVELR
ncbi:MAG: adenylate/guanylate cyclase domain-containing protein [Betaproteobacteria bacterium]